MTPVVLYVLHVPNYNLNVVIVAMVIKLNNSYCSMLVSNHLRLGFANKCSFDKYKNQGLFFYLKYIVLYELRHRPTPGFTEKQILLLPFK